MVCLAPQSQMAIGMSSLVLNVPMLSESASIDDAFRQMRAHNTSVSVIEVAGAHHLLDFGTVVTGLRERSPRTQSVVVLVQGRALPRVDRRNLDAWFAASTGPKGVPSAPTARPYALLGVTGGMAEIAIIAGLSDTFGLGSATPVMYECSVDPDHGPYYASEVGSPPRCPDTTHPAPGPAANVIG
jgi:hypothetical protein